MFSFTRFLVASTVLTGASAVPKFLSSPFAGSTNTASLELVSITRISIVAASALVNVALGLKFPFSSPKIRFDVAALLTSAFAHTEISSSSMKALFDFEMFPPFAFTVETSIDAASSLVISLSGRNILPVVIAGFMIPSW